MAPASSQSQEGSRTSEAEMDGAPLHPIDTTFGTSLDEKLELQRRNLEELRLILERDKNPLPEQNKHPIAPATDIFSGALPRDNPFGDHVELLKQKIYESMEQAEANTDEDEHVKAGLREILPILAKNLAKVQEQKLRAFPSTESKSSTSAIPEVKDEISSLLTYPIDSSFKGPTILYRVACGDKDTMCHDRLYLDPPQYKISHLVGEKPIADMDQFLKLRENPPFVVYRTYQCPGCGFSNAADQARAIQTDEVVSILSKDLLSILKRISKFAFDFLYDRDVNSERKPVYTTPNAYSHYFLYHHRREIYAKANGAPDGSPLKFFAQWLQTNPFAMYTDCDILFSKRMVSASTLFWFFPINGLFIHQKGQRKLGYVVEGIGVDKGKLLLSAWNWGYNGRCVFRINTMLSLEPPMKATKKIDDLGTYPLGYASEDVAKTLLDNGAKFWSLKQLGIHSYEGWDYKQEIYHTADSRWVIDYDAWLAYAGHEEYSKSPKLAKKEYDLWGDDLSSTLEPTLVQQMLLPQGIHAFNVKTSAWGYLAVNQIQPVVWNKDAFNRLTLPQRTKNMIKALVMTKKPTTNQSGSIETQKDKMDNHSTLRNGKSLILHFHGGTGTGKRFTAGKVAIILSRTEQKAHFRSSSSIAEYAEVPLYRIACGCWGVTGDLWIENLRIALERAKKWKAMVIFEDVDVILEKRPVSDVERNHLATVFFEAVAYFEGVVILTSSKVQAIDERLASYIQLSVHFPPLDKSARRAIWKNCIEQLRGDVGNSCVQGLLSHVNSLSSHQLNGDQIIHALTTARQMALYEKAKLDFRHIKDAIEVASDFHRQSELGSRE